MKIAYALAGEGRGHTTRAISLAKKLIEAGHEIQFFTCGDAIELLHQKFGEKSVSSLETPRFVIGNNGVAYSRTTIASIKFLFGHKSRLENCIRQLNEFGAEVLISDFEPTFARAAKKLKLPLISFNSQRFTIDTKLKKKLSRVQRLKLLPVKILCRYMAPKPNLSVISKGFNLEAKRPDIHLVGPMLRPAFHPDAWMPEGTHVVAYMRKSVLCHLDAIASHADKYDLKVKLYGHYPETLPPNVELCPISDSGFTNDLLTCDWICQTAGSQLLGEVGTLRVPTICFPDPNQVEQEINAVLAEKAYSNVSVIRTKKLSDSDLDLALAKCSTEEAPPTFENGTTGAFEIIQKFLNATSTIQKVNFNPNP